jgi:hypothetical protein
VKTTLDIDDSLHARAKEEAARRRMPLTGLIEEALRRLLDPQGPPRRRPKFKVKPRNLGMTPAFREMSMNRLAAQLEDESILDANTGRPQRKR